MNDIAPELLENIQERFEFLLESNYRLRKLYEEAEKGTATYKEANKFALEVGNALAKTYKSELSSDVLPDGKMYYNIAHKIFDDTLKNNYNIVADYCENVQKSLNEKAGISLKAQRPDLDEDRVRGFSELASNADRYDDVAAPVEEAAINFTQNVVNDSIKKNAEFQYDAGFKAKVVRDSSSDCCSWCDNLVGEYEYPKVPKEVYQRHAHCRCTVEYEPSKGKRQNVHTKEWIKGKNNEYGLKNSKNNDIMSTEKGTTHNNVVRIGTNDVDIRYILSPEYKEKFMKIDSDKELCQILYESAVGILRGNNGTDTETTKILSGYRTIINKKGDADALGVGLNKQETTIVRSSKGVVGIHNHPTNLPPNGSDFVAAGFRGYRYGIIATHDGRIYKYAIGDKTFSPTYLDNKIDGNIQDKGMPVLAAFETAIQDLREEAGIVCYEVK